MLLRTGLDKTNQTNHKHPDYHRRIVDEGFDHIEFILESMSCFIVSHVKEKSIDKSNAKFQWGMDDGRELSKQIPSFKYCYDRSLIKGMMELLPLYKLLAHSKKIQNLFNKLCIDQK